MVTEWLITGFQAGKGDVEAAKFACAQAACPSEAFARSVFERVSCESCLAMNALTMSKY